MRTRPRSEVAGGWPRARSTTALERLAEGSAATRLCAASITSPASTSEWRTTAAARCLLSGRTTSLHAHLCGDEHPLVVFVVIVVDAQRGRLALTHDAEDSARRLTSGDRIGLHAAS